MGTDEVSPSIPVGDDNGRGVVWLHDPADGNDAGPVMCGPVGFGRLLSEALAQAGLTEIAVNGVVRRLNRRGPLIDFDIAEADFATDVEAVENIKDAIREYLGVVEEQLRGEEIREIEVAV